MRWIVLLFLGAVVALTPTPARAESRNVAIKNTAFDPATLTVALRDTVIWKNDDQTEHTVTFEDRDLHPACPQTLLQNCLSPGETAERTFNQAGEYKYRCKLHSAMTGSIVVAAAETTTTTQPTTTTEPPTTVTTVATTTTTRQLATSSTMASTTTSTVPAETTTTITPSESPSFDPGDDGDGDGEAGAPASSSGGGGGSGTVALIVAVLLAVAGGGGVLLWRLRPRAPQP